VLDVALMIEGQDGLNWERWQRLAQAAEELGFAGLYRSDHFTNPEGPHLDAIELWVSLTYLATNTSRIEFGPMVSPVSFRNPVVTAWTAAAIDDLSGGRLYLGLGAGWQLREHESYGFDLLEVGQRFARFTEGIEVVTKLLTSDAPTAFDGEYYHLENALLLPRPKRAGGPPIVIGGNGPKRTLPLTAKYADEWNGVYVNAAKFADLSNQLDELLVKEGRQVGDVRRTLMTRVVIGKTEQEAIAKLDGDVDALRERGVLVGSPDQILEGLGKLADVGVQRVMAQWLDMDDMDGIDLLASSVLPQLG
jgi:F420-dependent oxidoreductase-like protein